MAVGFKTEELARKIGKILSEYGDEVSKILDKRGSEVVNAAVKDLKKTSPRSNLTLSRRKHYADNWTKAEETDRIQTPRRVIYNKSPTYRVAHLLENGHAKRGGGRVRAIPHIEPIEEKLVEDYIEKVKGDIQA